jgi:hypothetical protein
MLKPNFVGDSCVGSEDQNASRNADSEDQAPEVSDGNKDSD